MSKERLEEIKKIIENHKSWAKGTHYAEINYEELNEIDWLIEQAERAQELDELVIAYQTELSIKNNANKRIKKQNKRYREAVDYVMTAKTTHYNSLENALEDIRFVINETLEGVE